MDKLRITSEIKDYIKITKPDAPRKKKKISGKSSIVLKSPNIIFREEKAVPFLSLPK